MAEWPWPADTKDDKFRRIIDSYRTALMEVDATNCRLVDARMAEYGQSWISSNEPVDVNALKSAAEIAEQFGIQPWNIMDWSRRHPGKIPKHKRGGRVLFRVGDVIAYQAFQRRR